MSDLIDRYVMAVAANLSKRDRDDVPAELRDILYSKVEAKEAELGRRLTAKEEEALLRAYGHPLVVAASYGKHQTLIGPAVYPFYIFTLKVVGAILLAIILVKVIVAAVAGYPLGGDSDIGEALLTAGGVITLIFALIERYGNPEKLASKWRVGQLPQMGAPTARRTFEVMFEFFAAGVAALWLAGVIKIPDPAPGFIDLSLGPIWDSLRWPMVGYLLLQMAADVFELARPGLVRVNAALRIGYHLVGLAIVGVLWRADHWIDVAVTLPDRADLAQRLNENFNRGFKIGLAVTFFVFIFEIGRTALRLVRYGRLLRTQSA